jgi:tetratricopeptide (TPR) repeat protein
MSASAEPIGQSGGVSVSGAIGNVSGHIVGGDFTAHTRISIETDTVIFQSPSAGAQRPVLTEPSLTWFPLADAFEESGPNLFSLLRWDFRLAPTLHGRDDDLQKILAWCRGGSNTPTARLITGPGGVGKTRLAATAAEVLRLEGWSAGFLPASSDLVNMKFGAKGLFLILDYPEEQPERTSAVLTKLNEFATAPYPLRIAFLSRRSFAQWEPEALSLKGRFGRQEISGVGPLSVESGVALIGEAAANFAALVDKPLPDLRAARTWLAKSPMHRLPLYATAAAVHAVSSPTAMFGLSGAELVRQLALREAQRARKTSRALGLGDEGLPRFLALGILADGLSEASIRELESARICGPSAMPDAVTALAKSAWWRAGQLIRLEPDAPAVAFLDEVLFGPSFPHGRAELLDWLYLALKENASTFGSRLGRILYDLDVLMDEGSGTHALDASLVRMVTEKPERAFAFARVAESEVPHWAANFAAHVASILAERAANPENRAHYFNNAASYLSALGRHEEGLTAAQEAADLYRALARASPEAFTPKLAAALNTLAARLSELGRREEALTAAKEAVDIRRALALARPEAFMPDLAASLNNLAVMLSGVGRREEALTAAKETANLYFALALARPEAFMPDLAASLNNLATKLWALGRSEEALTAAQEALDIRRALALARPEAFRTDLAASLNNLAAILSDLWRREEALTAAQEAVDLYRELAGAHPETFTPNLAASLNNLAAMLSGLGRFEEALAAAQEAVDTRRELARARPEAGKPDLAMSLNTLANRLSDLGRREEALTAAQEAADLYRELAGARPEAFEPQLALSLNTLAISLSVLGRHKEAALAGLEATRLYVLAGEAFKPQLALSLNNLAAMLSDLGHRDDALRAAQEAVDLRRALAQARPEAFTPDLAASLDSLAKRLSELERGDDALRAAQEAVDLRRALAQARPEAFTPDLAASLNTLAAMLSDLGRREEALTAAQEVADLCRELARVRPERFTPELAGSLNNLAAQLSDLGRREEALKAVLEATKLYFPLAKARPEAFTPNLTTSLNNLVAILSGLGRREEALAIHEKLKRALPSRRKT